MASSTAAFEVLTTGPLALLQDEGRPGYAHLGVTASGAADRGAYAAANRLVGNEPGAAAIEVVFGGLELRALRTILVSLTGAPAVATVTEFARSGRHSRVAGPGVSAPVAAGGVSDGTSSGGGDSARGDDAPSQRGPAGGGGAPRAVDASTVVDVVDAARRIRRTVVNPAGTSFAVFAGDTIALGPPESGLRSYLAVRGGFAGERVLGSRSSDVLSGLGPAPLRVGEVLDIAGDEQGGSGDWPGTTLIPPPLPRSGPATLAISRGPRDDWFGDAGWHGLLDAAWTVGTDSNRVGVRLTADGAAIQRAPGHGGELPSEGMVVGAVQIPPSGQPVAFLRDHPVTGGYPVIGVLTEAALDRAAQLRPGDLVRFRSV
ncbi:biotin-dependent carboxyltransferase family protein [Herbiconiux sp. UC225_62]|uniref:5-oxoprolinase subunit C family protein n=1 Tax=Herbiconiux sp. UC225_62 TaxID=3350168 RepID=UPI0036D3E727